MAEEIVIQVKLDTKQAETQIKDFGQKAKTALDQPRDALGRFTKDTNAATLGIKSMGSAVSGLRAALGALAAIGAVALFERIGRSALDAAISIDRQVSSLRALTGSAEAAEKRFAALVAIAAKTPGLTTSLAATLDTQLRIFNVTEQTINKLLPVIGRLNAISPLGDPRQFINNLTQLISQNFERQDLKELVGASPIAGQLIKQIFDVDNPTNAEAIRASAKRLGVTTVERLAEELVNAGANNTALKNAVETLGGQFDKLQDRLNVALRPLGNEIAKTLIPLFEDLAKAAENFGPRAASVFGGLRTEITELSKALLEVASAMGQLSSRLGVFDFIKAGLRGAALVAADFADIIRGQANPFGQQGPRSLALQERFAREDRIARMTPEQLRSFALGSGDFLLEAEANRRLFVGPVVTPDMLARGGAGSQAGTSGGDSAGRKAVSERAKQIKELTEQILKSQEERLGEIVKDLEAINKSLVGSIVEEEKRIRADRLKSQRESRQVLTEAQDRREALERESIAELQRTSRRDLNRSGRFIGDLVNRGAITPAEAEALGQAANREQAQRLREILALEQQRGALTQARKDDLEDDIALYDRLGSAISDSERFMRGFNAATLSVGDAFERFGQNVSQALTNTKDLLNGLKQSVLSFFNDLLGSSLQNLMRQVLGPLFGGGGGAGGGIGGLFRTPGTFPAQIAQAFAGATGGGLTAPPSISQSSSVVSQIAQQFSNFGHPFAPRQGATGIFANGAFGAGLAGGSRFSLSAIGSSLAAAAPLLGLSLGASLGGQSTAGNILGAIGGGAVGLGLSFGASVFSAAGGGLGALGPAALAALGPIALIGAPLLIGAVLLGKASQRKKDEEASGQFLTQALQGIEQLAAGVASGQIDGSQARQVFETEILGTFRQQIGGLKTESVRRSRLTNQVADLRKVFEARIPPLIAEQERKAADAARFAAIDSRLIPEFATGGIARGGLALMHPNEMVLTVKHQRDIQALAGADVFNRVGVPGVNQSRVFDNGGIMPSASGQPFVIEDLTIVVNSPMSDREATAIVTVGMGGETGRRIVANNLKVLRRGDG